MREQADLILLVFAVALVQSGGGAESIAFFHVFIGHGGRGWTSKPYYRTEVARDFLFCSFEVTANLHSPERQLIELRIEHADLDASIDRLAEQSPVDELMLQRLKKRRLALRDAMARLEAALDPKEPA